LPCSSFECPLLHHSSSGWVKFPPSREANTTRDFCQRMASQLFQETKGANGITHANEIWYSFSSSAPGSDGAPVMSSFPVAVLGKAITSRKLSAWHKMATSLNTHLARERRLGGRGAGQRADQSPRQGRHGEGSPCPAHQAGAGSASLHSETCPRHGRCDFETVKKRSVSSIKWRVIFTVASLHHVHGLIPRPARCRSPRSHSEAPWGRENEMSSAVQCANTGDLVDLTRRSSS